jgi:hypothetical protein
VRIPGTVFSDDPGYRVDAENFCGTLNANVDNKKVSDREFRAFVRRTLPIVKFERRRPPCEVERLQGGTCPCTCLHTVHPVRNHADGCPEKMKRRANDR